MGRRVSAVSLSVVLGGAAVAANEGVPASGANGLTAPVVTVRASPPAVVPVDRRIVVQVAPHPENRSLRLAIDAGDYYRSTVIQLDGDKAARTHYVTWHAVPPGPYVLTAIVQGSQGVRGQHVERGGGLGAATHPAEYDDVIGAPIRADRTD